MARPCTCTLFKMLPLVELLSISNSNLKWGSLLQLSHSWGFNNRGLLGAVLIACVSLKGHLNCLNMLLIFITKQGYATMDKKQRQ